MGGRKRRRKQAEAVEEDIAPALMVVEEVNLGTRGFTTEYIAVGGDLPISSGTRNASAAPQVSTATASDQMAHLGRNGSVDYGHGLSKYGHLLSNPGNHIKLMGAEDGSCLTFLIPSINQKDLLDQPFKVLSFELLPFGNEKVLLSTCTCDSQTFSNHGMFEFALQFRLHPASKLISLHRCSYAP